MSASNNRLAASVRALREVTAEPADGRATRARILGRLARRGRRRPFRLGMSALLVVWSLLIPAASAAIFHLSKAHWTRTTPPAVSPVLPPVGVTSIRSPAIEEQHEVAAGANPARIEPPETAPATSRAPGRTPELVAYARAHQAHFHQDSPRRALRLWNAYLNGFPHGRFWPEAELNRAICLVRLGESDRARVALKRLIARDGPQYPVEQAKQLLAKLDER